MILACAGRLYKKQDAYRYSLKALWQRTKRARRVYGEVE